MVDYKQFFANLNSDIRRANTSGALKVTKKRAKSYLEGIKSSPYSVKFKKNVRKQYGRSLKLIKGRARKILR